ncbi:MAG: OmpA family protein, partial [Bacteroidales bacterium]|nr:OmpA family protein [Bacteroidales bacterium]
LYGGVGVGIKLAPWLTFAVQTALEYPLTDIIDGTKGDVVTAPNKINDIFHENSVALFFTPGKAKDSDGDGVVDKKDMCPDTPKGVEVDENGCPLDTDKDGVYDYQDECPKIPGLKEFNGCPDSDGDGIQDKEDACPDVPGLAILKGCPDSDGDGVADKDDRCPDTPKGWQVDRFGCPIDRDRDGIPDSEDQCPDQPGVAELKGCPFDPPTLMAKYGLANDKILFDFDSSSLKDGGMQTLGKIADALSNHDDFGVHLDGNTDWTGTNKYNLGLSLRRVDSAKKYLISKGILDSRIKTEYFGEDKPVMDNHTKEGRKFNRRVDFNFFKIK